MVLRYPHILCKLLKLKLRQLLKIIPKHKISNGKRYKNLIKQIIYAIKINKKQIIINLITTKST
jgi:hypothetical protein